MRCGERSSVQISTMPVPAYSRSSSVYSTARSFSLDRHHSSLSSSPSTASSSSTYSSTSLRSRPPRPTLDSSSRSKFLPSSGADLELPRISSSMRILDISSGRRSNLLRQRLRDTMPDVPDSLVLMGYRGIGDSIRAASPVRRLSISDDNNNSTISRMNGTNGTSIPSATNTAGRYSRLSSKSKLQADDLNQNHLYPDSPGRDSGLSRSITPSTSSHLRTLGFSSSSVDSGGSSSSSSSSDNSPALRRTRRLSSTSEESSSGISAGSSRSGGKSEKLEKAPLGLRNLRNTCFMNSIIQCLCHTKPLLEYFLKDQVYRSDINVTTSQMKGALVEAFAELFKAIWRQNGGSEYAVSPHAFKNQIQKFAPRFMGHNQQDSQEFLHYLLQGLHEDINRVTIRPRPIHTDIDDSLSDNQKAAESWKRYLRFDDSRIVDLFVGQLKSTLKCSVCGHKSVTFDPFWDLSLPLPKSSAMRTSLQECLSLFTKEEVLDGDEKPKCDNCKSRQRCTKSFTIHKCPRILVLHLKRFSPSERFRAKLNTPVDFPLTNLDMGPYMSNNQSAMYNLYAVSNHSGSTYSGHYTATCLHPKTDVWHECNDARVSETSRIVSAEAYVLFYEATTQSSRL